MENNSIIIDSLNLKKIKELLSEGRHNSLLTRALELLIEQLERKWQECEGLNQRVGKLCNLNKSLISKRSKVESENNRYKQALDKIEVIVLPAIFTINNPVRILAFNISNIIDGVKHENP